MCFYKVIAQCNLPKVTVDSVSGASIYYGEFTPKNISIALTSSGSTVADGAYTTGHHFRSTVFENVTDLMANGSLAINGELTDSLNPFKIWGTTEVGVESSYVIPADQTRCEDRVILVAVVSHSDSSSIKLTFENIGFLSESAVKTVLMIVSLISVFLI